jgi:serine protease Do
MGLSFAIPIDVAMDVVEQLKTKGRVSRGWLGVLIQDVTRELAPTFGLKRPEGALVAQVLPDSPAAAAGVLPGDVILSYGGKELTASSALPPLVGATPVGEKAQLEVMRKGQRVSLEVTIAELPDEEQLAGGNGESAPLKTNRLGLVVGNLTSDQRQQLGIEQNGVVVEEVAEGPAARAGITAGDVILMLDNQDVADLDGFNRILEAIDPGRSVAVLIQRGDGRMFYAIRMPNS